jgi:hypothetical protein
MADVSTVALSAGVAAVAAGLVAGGVAYAVGSARAKRELRKVEAEREQVELLRERQASYHRLLNAERQMRGVIWHPRGDGAGAGWRSTEDEFRESVNGVIIAGSEAAARAAQALEEAYNGTRTDHEAADTALRSLVEAIRWETAMRLG